MNFHERVQAKKEFASSFDQGAFFSIFADPIYKASVIYLFSALKASDIKSLPSSLRSAWKDSLKRHQIDPENPSLTYLAYERMIYEVWDQFSWENPNCCEMDLPDLLKKKIKSLDSNVLCSLYEAMNREPNHENRYLALLSFFSDNGNLYNIHWLLEGLVP